MVVAIRPVNSGHVRSKKTYSNGPVQVVDFLLVFPQHLEKQQGIPFFQKYPITLSDQKKVETWIRFCWSPLKDPIAGVLEQRCICTYMHIDSLL